VAAMAAAATAATAAVRVLLVDNYDSYTFNLFQRLLASGATGGIEPLVLPNDRLTWCGHVHAPFAPCAHSSSVSAILSAPLRPEMLALLPHVDMAVVSPGPGRPDRAAVRACCCADGGAG
jgi:anthranilate/para-aminobenzoate synthase component II